MTFSRSTSRLTHQSGSFLAVEVGDRLAEAGEVVEVPARHGLPDLQVDPRRLLLDARLRGLALALPRVPCRGRVGRPVRRVLLLHPRHGTSASARSPRSRTRPGNERSRTALGGSMRGLVRGSGPRTPGLEQGAWPTVAGWTRCWRGRTSRPAPASWWSPGRAARSRTDRARLFAAHGATALTIRWFGGPGQQPGPYEVPLETFTAALDRLAAETDRLGVLGTSFGAEAALLVATLDPRVDGRGRLRAELGRLGGRRRLGRRRSPDLALDLARGAAAVRAPRRGLEPGHRPAGVPSGMYETSLARADPDAAIPVERIAGEVLLVAGDDDQVWPSAEFARRIVGRRAAAGLADAGRPGPGAGHRVVLPARRRSTAGQAMARGGTPRPTPRSARPRGPTSSTCSGSGLTGPVEPVEVVQPVVDRVVGLQLALADAGEAGLLERPPGRGVRDDDRLEDRGRLRVRRPRVLDEREDDRRADAAPDVVQRPEEVVDRQRARRDLDQRGQRLELLGVVLETRSLHESDGPTVEEGNEVLARLLAAGAGSEVAGDAGRPSRGRGSTTAGRAAPRATRPAAGSRTPSPGGSSPAPGPRLRCSRGHHRRHASPAAARRARSATACSSVRAS